MTINASSIKLLINISGSKVTLFPNIYGKITGSAASGILLSQFSYWSGNAEEDDCWFTKTQDEIEDHICLSRREQETARSKLVELGLLETKKIGIPARNFYRIDFEKLAYYIQEFPKNSAKSLKSPGWRKTPTKQTSMAENDILEKSNTYDEENTENSAKSLKSPGWRKTPHSDGGKRHTGEAENANVYKNSKDIYKNKNKRDSGGVKGSITFELPPNIDVSKWNDYLETRKMKKCANTQSTTDKCLAFLIKAEEEHGIPPNDMLDYAIDTGWAGLRHSLNGILNDRKRVSNHHNQSDDYWDQAKRSREKFKEENGYDLEDAVDIIG